MVNSYELPENVEDLALTGVGDFLGAANGLANLLTGGAGNDTLDGRGGADTLQGGAGDDSYFIDNVGDGVRESIG